MPDVDGDACDVDGFDEFEVDGIPTVAGAGLVLRLFGSWSKVDNGTSSSSSDTSECDRDISKYWRFYVIAGFIY